MNGRGKSLLMCASILLVIFGGFAVLEVLVVMGSFLSSGSAWLIAVGVYVLAMCAAEFTFGLIGVIRCGKPSRGKFFIVSGAVLFVLSGINIARLTFAGAFQVTLLIGLALPALFIAGGAMRRRAGPDAAAPEISAPRRAASVIAIAALSALAAAMAGLPFINHSLTIMSLKKLDDYPLYSMTYYGDYSLNYEADNPEIGHHCTAFLAFNGKGEPLYCRNFDDAFQSHPITMLTTSSAAKSGTIAMSDIYFMGYNPAHLPTGSIFADQALLSSPRVPTDGMNEYGVAISFLGVPYHDGDSAADPDKKSVDQTAMIRMVLDGTKNVDEAIQMIKSYNVVLEGAHVPAPGEPGDHDGLDSTHYLLADASGDSAIVEFIGGETVIVRKTGPWQVVTNFIVSGQSREGVGQDRYDIAEDELRARNGVLTEDEAMALLRKVSQIGTHWSAVYNLKTGEVRLAMARDYDDILHFKLNMHE